MNKTDILNIIKFNKKTIELYENMIKENESSSQKVHWKAQIVKLKIENRDFYKDLKILWAIEKSNKKYDIVVKKTDDKVYLNFSKSWKNKDEITYEDMEKEEEFWAQEWKNRDI